MSLMVHCLTRICFAVDSGICVRLFLTFCVCVFTIFEYILLYYAEKLFFFSTPAQVLLSQFAIVCFCSLSHTQKRNLSKYAQLTTILYCLPVCVAGQGTVVT